MDKKESENEPRHLLPGERDLEDLEEAFRILRSLPDSVERDEAAEHVLAIVQSVERRVQARQNRKQ